MLSLEGQSLKSSVNTVLSCIIYCVLLQVHGYHIYLNTGRFANESVRQRPVRHRMKSIRQRRMSVGQRLYASHFGTQCPKDFFVWLGSG